MKLNLLLYIAVLVGVSTSAALQPTCDPMIYSTFYPSKEKCKCLLSESDTEFTKVADGGTTTLHLFNP
jgi:hypothetical protein